MEGHAGDEGKKLISFSPSNGVFVFRTTGFKAPRDENPILMEGEGTYEGRKYTYEKFTVNLVIEEPESVKGIPFPFQLRSTSDKPMFLKKTIDGKDYLWFGASGKYVDQLEEYFVVSGVFDDKYELLWEDNPLPTLQRIILHEDRKFQGTVKNGWMVIGSLLPVDLPDETPFDAAEDFTPTQSNPDFVTDDSDDKEIPFEAFE